MDRLYIHSEYFQHVRQIIVLYNFSNTCFAFREFSFLWKKIDQKLFRKKKWKQFRFKKLILENQRFLTLESIVTVVQEIQYVSFKNLYQHTVPRIPRISQKLVLTK